MTGEKLRGNAIKYLPVFQDYVKRFGIDAVKEVLMKKKTNDGNFRLIFSINTKDRMQILKHLGDVP